MARDPIRVLQTIRRRSVEEARHALGACLAAEAEAAERIRSIDEAARRDRMANRAVEQSHQFLEMFALRLQVSRTERRSAEAALMAAQTRSADARAAVVAARTAAEAVETLVAERAAAAEREANGREQHALDDIARACRGQADGPASGGGR